MLLVIVDKISYPYILYIVVFCCLRLNFSLKMKREIEAVVWMRVFSDWLSNCAINIVFYSDNSRSTKIFLLTVKVNKIINRASYRYIFYYTEIEYIRTVLSI